MKLIEYWRFAIKCMKLSYNLKVNLITVGLLCVMGLLYEIGNISNGIGGILLLTVGIYPAQMIYSICGSQLVLSSPYKKALMTSVPAVITFCSSILAYLLVIGIEGIRSMGDPKATEYSAHLILLFGMVLMLLEFYVGIAYKYFLASMITMIGCLIGAYYLAGIFGDSTVILLWFSGVSMPVAIVAGLCFAVLGSLLQYGVSLLVYKKTISRTAIYGLARQQA